MKQKSNKNWSKSKKTDKESKSQNDPEKDLDLSYKIQHAMAPNFLPKTQGIDIASIFLPCNTVGGDLYDVIQISDDKIAFYLFDVSVSGISSILISSLAKVLFSDVLLTISSPQVILERVNSKFIEHIPNNFIITAFVAILDLHNNKLTYCNAGHTYPILYKRKDKSIIPLKTPGIFLGVYKNANFQNETLFLAPDDWLFIISDGLYSLFDIENEIKGRKKFESFITEGNYQSPAQFISKSRKLYKTMITKYNQRDDITAIVVEILTQSRKNQIKNELGFDESTPVFLQYLSYYEEIDTVSAQILKEMDEIGFSDEVIRKMKLTITELLANAIGHGNEDDHSKKVIVGHVVEINNVKVAILDEGKGFDPDKIPDPTLPENLIKDHGRGLYIVQNYVDEISFNAKGNRVLIRKSRFPQNHEKE